MVDLEGKVGMRGLVVRAFRSLRLNSWGGSVIGCGNLTFGWMPKLYEYFGLVFLFYSDDHDPMHLHVQAGSREGIIMLIILEGKLVELRWRAKRGASMLHEKEKRDAESFVRAMKDDIVEKWTAFYVEHKRIKPVRITRRIK